MFFAHLSLHCLGEMSTKWYKDSGCSHQLWLEHGEFLSPLHVSGRNQEVWLRCSEMAPARSSLITPISPRSRPVSVCSLMKAWSRWTGVRICTEIIAYISFLVFLHKTEFLLPLCGNMLSGPTQLPPTAHRFISYRCLTMY